MNSVRVLPIPTGRAYHRQVVYKNTKIIGMDVPSPRSNLVLIVAVEERQANPLNFKSDVDSEEIEFFFLHDGADIPEGAQYLGLAPHDMPVFWRVA